MYRIGLTGGIATGKSTVAAILRKLGARVIDADQIAREIMLPGQAAYQDIIDHFGPNVLACDGQLDRDYLAKHIFADADKRELLNKLTHPRVICRIDKVLDCLAATDYRLPAVLDVPLLIEAGMHESVDEVWVVVADAATQLQRLMQRNNYTQKEALGRIHAQLPLAYKIKFAHRLIDNNGSLADTEEVVAKYWELAINASGDCYQ